MGRNNKRRKEEICEDFCFNCKDGGLLIICDYKDCLKAYHPECAGKDETFIDSGERWNCYWHSCFICHKLPKFYCLCCPQAVCGRCIYQAEFVIVKEDKGICQNCLNLALLIEDGPPPDSKGVTINFDDENSHEYFFIDYWKYIRKKEGLTKECLHSANELLKKDKNYSSDPYLVRIGKVEENLGESEEESHCIVSDYDDLEEVDLYKPGRERSKSKKKMCEMKGKAKVKKKEFVGWGSKSLLEFLGFLGQDTSKPMDEYEVASIVIKYCMENKLFDPQKKKRIVCDDMLCSLFGKKFLLKNTLNKLLAVHFASNFEQSSGGGQWSSSDHEDATFNFTRQKSLGSLDRVQKEKECPHVQKSDYALVNTENIKLVYLKRSLVEDLLKQPEEFDKKVVGSFVRVKCNPNDYLQRNSHQLLQVKGVTASSNGQILLQFSDCPEDFPVCKISDDDFTEEECEDLCGRVKDGLLKKLTVVELEQKAKSLHHDIINHWIPKELALLRRRIDQANEKGWRREMSEYLDRLLLLKDEAEQQRLLNEYPEILAEPIVQDCKEYNRDGKSCSPDPPARSASQFLDSDFSSGNFSYHSETEAQRNASVTSPENPPQECHIVVAPEVEEKHRQPVLEIKESRCETSSPEELRQKCQVSPSEGQANMNIQSPLQSYSSSGIGEGNTYQLHDQDQSTSKVEVIELSDDEPNVDMVETRSQPLKDPAKVGDTAIEEKHNQSVLETDASNWKTLFPNELRQKRQASPSEGQTNMSFQPQLQSSCSSAIGEMNTSQLHDQGQSTSMVEVIPLSDDEPNEYKDATRSQPVKDLYTPETRKLKRQCNESARTSHAELLGSSQGKQYGKIEIGHRSLVDANFSLWYYRTVLGHRVGPFLMSSLKERFETIHDQDLEIKVWEKDWKEEDAILLEDAMHKFFPGT